MLDFSLEFIQDNPTREALQRLVEELQTNPFIKNRGQLISIEATSAVTNKKQAHQLPFKPKHAVLLSKTGSATVTFNYDNFDADTIDVTTSGATTITAYVGTFGEGL